MCRSYSEVISKSIRDRSDGLWLEGLSLSEWPQKPKPEPEPVRIAYWIQRLSRRPRWAASLAQASVAEAKPVNFEKKCD